LPEDLAEDLADDLADDLAGDLAAGAEEALAAELLAELDAAVLPADFPTDFPEAEPDAGADFSDVVDCAVFAMTGLLEGFLWPAGTRTWVWRIFPKSMCQGKGFFPFTFLTGRTGPGPSPSPIASKRV
jgi:hypothetical protein